MSKISQPVRLEQIKAFLNANGYRDAALHPLAGDASFRRYIRVRHGAKSAMLMDAPPDKEDMRPYVAIASHLCRQGYSAPAIFAQAVGDGLFLLEDLGDDSYTSVLKRDGAIERELYAAAVDILAEWHDARKPVADRKTLPLPDYDAARLLKEALLFADWFLPQALGKEKAAGLRAEYAAIWRAIIDAAPIAANHWVHRDYHADNLMWLPARSGLRRVGLLDFQDGVYGDAAYDLVSLLEDARRDVNETLAEAMILRYAAASGADRQRLQAAYAILGAQRNCKIIGIFSRLAARDGKYAYLQHLPRVWRYLEHDVKHPALATLKTWLDKHVPAECRGVITVRHTSQDLALSA
jgi:aminoglycoside/choline kinase family phosphotransferase